MNQIRKQFERIKRTDRIYLNDTYQVNVEDVLVEEMGADMLWLSIKRLDKEAIHDWRDFQEIKNQIVGPENEGFELYPAESRRVDTSNQYHLFVFKDPSMRVPVGYTERAVVDGDGKIGRSNHRQRPL